MTAMVVRTTFRRRIRRTVALLGAAAVIGGCTNASFDDTIGDAPAPTFVTPSTNDVATVDDSPFATMTGIARSWSSNPDFSGRLAGIDPTATDQAAAASAYDAVIIAALAAEEARSDAPGRIASAIPGITVGGEPCLGFANCRAKILKRTDIAYTGYSGSAALERNGIPLEGEFEVVRISTNGVPTASESVGGQLRSPGELGESSGADPRSGPLPDGILRVGTLLPTDLDSPGLTTASRSAMAGVRLAVEEINEYTVGGVIGSDLDLLDDASGTGTPDDIARGAQALVDAGADVIIGGLDSTTTQRVLDVVRPAGVVLISPLDGGAAQTAGADGRFFRTTPTAELQGWVVGQLASFDGHTGVVIVDGASDDERVVADNMAMAFTSLDGTITSRVELTSAGQAAAVAAIVAAAQPTAILITADVDSTAAFARAMHADGFGPTEIGWYGAPWLVTDDAAAVFNSTGG